MVAIGGKPAGYRFRAEGFIAKEWMDTKSSSSSAVTYFTYGKTDQRLAALHTYHSSLTCFSEGTRVTGKVLQFLTRLSIFSDRAQG